jgi:hypothetical protein
MTPRARGSSGLRSGAGRALACGAACVASWVFPCVIAPTVAAAHGFEPALLAVVEGAPGSFEVSLRAKGEDGELLVPVFPGGCTESGAAEARTASGRWERTSTLACPGGLRGEPIGVRGLEGGRVDVLLRVTWAGGEVDTASLRRGQDTAVVGRAGHGLGTYLVGGARHVLSGPDHLLFVLCLLLLSRRPRDLLVALTAFTAAHSATLSLAALDVLRVPAAPIEACIALSVAYLARMILLPLPGGNGEPDGSSGRSGGSGERGAARPRGVGLWGVAFSAGLLHGMGLAGGLSELGLPRGGVAAALLGFNLGVEAGQLGFVAVASLGLWALRRGWRQGEGLAVRASAYAAGVVAMTWAFQRVAAFWSPVW